jgi:hypothetical protein
MGGEILALDEAESTGNIRSDLSRARQRSPAAKDPDQFRKFVLRTALDQRLRINVGEVKHFRGVFERMPIVQRVQSVSHSRFDKQHVAFA